MSVVSGRCPLGNDSAATGNRLDNQQKEISIKHA